MEMFQTQQTATQMYVNAHYDEHAKYLVVFQLQTNQTNQQASSSSSDSGESYIVLDDKENARSASNNCVVETSTAFDPSSEHLIRLRGIAWSANKHEIAEFLYGVNILNGLKGIHFIVDNMLGYGEAFVQLASNKDFHLARLKHNQYLGDRYIESK